MSRNQNHRSQRPWPAFSFVVIIAVIMATVPPWIGPVVAQGSRNAPLGQGALTTSRLRGNVISLDSSIGKATLLRGESTWASVVVEGVRGIQSDVCLKLNNLSPEIIRITGPTEAVFTPEEMNGGKATFRTNLQGVTPGAFNIQTEVNVCGKEHYQRAQGDYPDALRRARADKNREAESGILRNMGLAAERLGQLQEAAARYAEAIAIFRELGMLAREADTLNRHGGVSIKIGKYQEARQDFEQSLELARDMKLPLWIWRSREGLGDTNAAQGESSKAIDEYKASVKSIEDTGADLDATRRAVYEKLVALLGGSDDLKGALQYVQEARIQALRSALRLQDIVTPDANLQGLLAKTGELQEKRSEQYEVLRGLFVRPKDEQDRTSIKSTTDLIGATDQDLNKTLAEIRQKYPGFSNMVQVDPSVWLDSQQMLPAGVTLVQYFQTDDALFIFAISAGAKPALKKKDISRAAMEEMIRRYQDEITGRRDTTESAKNLYQVLIEPVRQEIESAQVLALMPSGTLFYVPFAALAREVPGQGLRYLIEDKPLVYLTDLTAWRLMRENGESATGAPVWVGLANPSLDLPDAETEVNAIAKLFPNKQVYLRDQATKTRVEHLRDDCTILHLASHGYLDGELLTRSFIRLAGDDLTQGEIYGLGLRRKRTRLVVLSACETAVGSRRPGLEFLGLADAFAKAGASSIVGTLWKIADKSTAQFMTVFYTALTDPQKHSSKAQALREAQLALIRGRDYRHPFYWAPFVLVGDWR
jgi:CHAT domain-containing protein